MVIQKHFQFEANRTFLSDSDNNNSQGGGYGNHPFRQRARDKSALLPDCFFASPSKTGETQE
ncbi:unnamed protein product [Eruca vesicaria subsp. sativa]|uniref:Uncharacterized protein n=1 Tax=Eruca vesicaria subsp. sativa TaxID=29727 RepID=A0ABC8LY68_ERUVS|nr:unnamed protein product [Eruca vesicaria subsp. sativa]